LLKKAKWLRFIQKFKGHNKEVMKAFTRSFNDQVVEIGDLKFTVTEASIAAYCKLMIDCFSHFPQLIQLSAAGSTFHNCFVKL